MTDLKERCWVGGVQPVVGMGRVRWKRVGDGVGVGDERGAAESDGSAVEGDGGEVLRAVIVLPMKPPITPARTAITRA